MDQSGRLTKVLLAIALGAAATCSPASARTAPWGALSVSAAPIQHAANALISISFTNISEEAETFRFGLPIWLMTDLVVTDSEGRIVHPGAKGGERVVIIGSIHEIELRSNGLFNYGWEEQRLSNWGYALPPGTYRVYAVFNADGWRNPKFTNGPATANAISITLL